MNRIAEELSRSSRPLIWAGYGVRLAGMAQRFREFVDATEYPVVTTWGGADLLPTDHPQNIGIVGISGQRGANEAVQAADLLLVLGSHLSLPQTSTLTDQFAPNARKVIVDVDPGQLTNMTTPVDVAICADLREFFDWWPGSETIITIMDGDWLSRCAALKLRSPPPLEGSYALNHAMTRLLPPGTCMVIDGGGTALYTGFQSSYIKEGSRLICSMSMSAMGSGLPESIGACFAAGKKLTTCLIGDGSLMLNLQELQTIATHRLPIKIFVINNGGYLAIRQTQKAFQDGRYYGVGGSDLEFPELWRVGYTFNIPVTKSTETALEFDGPVICEWLCMPNQPMVRQGYLDGKPMPLDQMVYA